MPHATALPLAADLDTDTFDVDFPEVCDARRDRWLAAHDAEQREGERPADGFVDDEPAEEPACPDCAGCGEGAYGQRCPVCRGRGTLRAPAGGDWLDWPAEG